MKKSLIWFVAIASFVSIMAEPCLALREEAALGEGYQLEPEKETLEDRLSWEVGVAYGLPGLSLLGMGSKRFPERPSREFLDTLDMTYSENYFLLALGAKYLVTPRLELYAGLPATLLLQTENNEGGGRRRKGGLTSKWGGVGDIYGGISYAILTESKRRPLVIATLDVNSTSSKYTSMGDGFWGFTPKLSVRKFVSGPLYLKGFTAYTRRLDRKGVDPGAIVSYGGGIGFLSGDKNIELNLERTHTAKTKTAGRTLLNSEEDLVMDIAFTTIFGKQTSTFGLSWGGLEEGFDWGKNYAGIYFGVTF